MLAAGGRIVVKLVSPDVLHKSDLGGVVLDVATAGRGRGRRPRHRRPGRGGRAWRSTASRCSR